MVILYVNTLIKFTAISIYLSTEPVSKSMGHSRTNVEVKNPKMTKRLLWILIGQILVQRAR